MTEINDRYDDIANSMDLSRKVGNLIFAARCVTFLSAGAATAFAITSYENGSQVQFFTATFFAVAVMAFHFASRTLSRRLRDLNRQAAEDCSRVWSSTSTEAHRFSPYHIPPKPRIERVIFRNR